MQRNCSVQICKVLYVFISLSIKIYVIVIDTPGLHVLIVILENLHQRYNDVVWRYFGMVVGFG